MKFNKHGIAKVIKPKQNHILLLGEPSTYRIRVAETLQRMVQEGRITLTRGGYYKI